VASTVSAILLNVAYVWRLPEWVSAVLILEIMFSLEAMALGSAAFELVAVERGETAEGFDKVAAAGSAELLVFCRGGTLIDDEEVNRPIKIPVSNAVIAIKIGRAKRCMAII
jgi:hypothetical protein